MKRAWPTWLRWAWMLPVLELVMSATLAVPTLKVDRRAQNYLAEVQREHLAINIRIPDLSQPPTRPNWKTAMSDLRLNGTEIVVLANIPGVILDLAVTAFRHRATLGMNDTFLFDKWAWGAMLYPFSALPFWWALGRSIDASHSRKDPQPMRLRWWDLVLMLPVALGSIAFYIDYQAEATPADRGGSDFLWATVAMGIWGAAAAGAAVIWFQQWRRERSQSRPTPA